MIAASSRGNTPPEPTRVQAAIDDRLPENISYGATNLVQKNITGRSRQQSEPPLNRTFLPPTPPPDADKASTKSSSGSSLGANGRPGSMRAARPPRLNLDRPGAQIQGRSSADVTALEKPRLGTTRTASEPRGPASRQYPRGPNGLETDRNPSFHDIGGHRRNASDTGFAPSVPAAYEDDGFGVYPSARNMNSGRKGVQQPRYIDEEEEYEGIGSRERITRDGPDGSENTQRRTRSPTRESRRADSRRPSVRRFRIKVHAFEDTRYIMIGPTIEYGEFENRIREKFGFRTLLRVRMQDEGDMITMVDQEDLDLLLSSATETARREGSEMGKMEVSHTPLFSSSYD